MSYEFVWIFLSYFADIAYWLGFAVSFLIVYPFMDKKDKGNVGWIIYALLPAVFLSYTVHEVIGLIFRVPRPCAGLAGCPIGYSFPSGHASIIFAFAAIVTLYGKKYKSYLWVIPLAMLVGLSRVFLNYHTPVDIIGGAVVGTFSGLLVYRLSDKFKKLFQRIGILKA